MQQRCGPARTARGGAWARWFAAFVCQPFFVCSPSALGHHGRAVRDVWDTAGDEAMQTITMSITCHPSRAQNTLSPSPRPPPRLTRSLDLLNRPFAALSPPYLASWAHLSLLAGRAFCLLPPFSAHAAGPHGARRPPLLLSCLPNTSSLQSDKSPALRTGAGAPPSCRAGYAAGRRR